MYIYIYTLYEWKLLYVVVVGCPEQDDSMYDAELSKF